MKDSICGCRPGHADRYATLELSFPHHAAGRSRQSSYSLVPRKRFRRNKMNFLQRFVPRKRFKSYQIDCLLRFVPRKRFRWDKMPQTRRLAMPMTSLRSEQQDSQVQSYRNSYFILYGWSSYRVKRLALRTHFCSSSLTYSLASWKEISPERYEASFSSASFL